MHWIISVTKDSRNPGHLTVRRGCLVNAGALYSNRYRVFLPKNVCALPILHVSKFLSVRWKQGSISLNLAWIFFWKFQISLKSSPNCLGCSWNLRCALTTRSPSPFIAFLIFLLWFTMRLFSLLPLSGSNNTLTVPGGDSTACWQLPSPNTESAAWHFYRKFPITAEAVGISAEFNVPHYPTEEMVKKNKHDYYWLLFSSSNLKKLG